MTLSASTSSRGSSVFLLLVSATLHLSGAFDDHVPTSVCQSMTPSHGALPQTSASPYVLTASAACYVPGQALTVSLSGVGSSTTYKGLLVEARLSGSNTASYGTFSTNGDTDIQTLSCFGQANSAVCHANSNPKLVKSFLWTPPAMINSPIEITATVLQSYTKFWTGVKTTINVCAALSVSNDTDAAASSSSSSSSSSMTRPSMTTSLAQTDGPSSSTATPIVPSTPGYDTGNTGSSSSSSSSTNSRVRSSTSTTSLAPTDGSSSSTSTPIVPSTPDAGNTGSSSSSISDSSSTKSYSTTTSSRPSSSISSSTPTRVMRPSTSRRDDSSGSSDSSDSADSDDQSSERGRWNARWNKITQNFGKPTRRLRN